MPERHLGSVPDPGELVVTNEARALIDQLGPKATVSDRLQALGQCGLDKTVLHEQGIIHSSTYDGYLEGKQIIAFRPVDEIVIDDIRMVARHMLSNGLSPQQVGKVFTSRLSKVSNEELDGKTLLEATVVNPVAALAHVIGQYGYVIPDHEHDHDLPPAA